MTLFTSGPEDLGVDAEGIDAALTRAREGLAAVGFPRATDDQGLAVVRLRVAGGVPLVVEAEDGRAVFVREVTGVADGATLALPAPRTDGPPTAADLGEATDRILEHLDAAARPAGGLGPGTFAWAVAGRALAGVEWPGNTPPWLPSALRAWVAERALPPPSGSRVHLCAPWRAEGPAGRSRWLRPDGGLDAGAVRCLGRALGVVLEGVTDAPARFASIAASADRGEKAWAAAFGGPFADALARALGEVAEPGGSCDAAGTLPCPLCRGCGRVTVACPWCEGLGLTACSACGGEARCFAPGCRGGGRRRAGSEDLWRCAFCFGTSFYLCRACDDRGSMPCKVCRRTGKATWPCPACGGARRMPCPLAGPGPLLSAWTIPTGDVACPWCGVDPVGAACATCDGTGTAGCSACRGGTWCPCEACSGEGCAACFGIGKRPCGTCKRGAGKCWACRGSGTAPLLPDGCVLCGGTQRRRGAADAARRLQAARRGSLAASKAAEEIRDRAVGFLLGCRGEGYDVGFGVRELRSSRAAPAGKLLNATTFSSAICLWALASVGLGRDDPRLSGSWRVFEAQVEALLQGATGPVGTQEASLALRALVSGGEPAESPRVQGLVRLLVRGQLSNGLWTDEIGLKGDGDEFQALFALESLYLARRRGVAVPSGVWSKALSGAQRAVRKATEGQRKASWVTGTDVASSTALVVICLYGTLSERGRPSRTTAATPRCRRGSSGWTGTSAWTACRSSRGAPWRAGTATRGTPPGSTPSSGSPSCSPWTG